MKKLLTMLLTLCLLLGCALGEENVAVTVNGEGITQTAVEEQLAYYVQLYESYGLDASAPETQEELRQMALSALIDNALLTQDMTAAGAYEFTEAAWQTIEERAAAAYAGIVTQLCAYCSGESAQELVVQAQALAASLGYTIDTLVAYYQNDLASEQYAQMLMADESISDAQVEAAYAARVADSEEKFANDVPAFEMALINQEEAWFVPQGYRCMLQIMLRSDAEDKLSDTAERVAEIYARLSQGEDFAALIRAYGEDESFDDETFFENGYMVHPDSITWEERFVTAAFALTRPGEYSDAPIVSDSGVHILYYLKDHEGGAVALSDALRESLRQSLYSERANERVLERLAELRESAQIVY